MHHAFGAQQLKKLHKYTWCDLHRQLTLTIFGTLFWGVNWMGPDPGCDAGTRSCTRGRCTGGARCALVPSLASTSNQRLTFSLLVGNTRLTCTSRRFGIVHKRFTHNTEQYKVHGRHQNTSNTRDTQLSQTQLLSRTMRSGRRAHARPGGRVSKHGGHFGMLPASL